MEAGAYRLPAQPHATQMKKAARIQRLSNRVHGGAQKRKPRLREIQTSKPPPQGGGISQPLGIFNSGRRSFPATTFHKVAPKRLATGDQTVVAIGQREGRQKGEGLPAHIAVAAPNRNPVMVFVVSLFAPAAVTDDGIAQTNRALTKDRPASFDPVGFEVVLSRRK